MRARIIGAVLGAGMLTVSLLPVAAPPAVGAATASPMTATTADQFSTAGRHVRRSPDPPPLVRSIRAAHHRGFDRITVSLRGGPPGFDVRYVRRLIQDPSARPIDLLGPVSLRLVLLPANGHDPDTGASTITTPLRTRWRLDQLRESAVIGDFEAVFTLGVGLRHRAPFRVLTLRHPTRIVVDVRHL